MCVILYATKHTSNVKPLVKQYHYVGCVLKTFYTSLSVYIFDRAERVG